jgi:cation diffusion facilitator CzcD-associated flavoprotein CzcO
VGDQHKVNETGAKRRRIAVIGAGPSGLVTAKELIQQSHDVVAFEQQPMIGGVFANHYDELLLTSSNLLTSFGDHSSRDVEARVWSCGEYLEYLYSYAARFERFLHIRFSTRITSVRRDADTGRWRVRARSAQEEVATARRQVLDSSICAKTALSRSCRTGAWQAKPRTDLKKPAEASKVLGSARISLRCA